MAGLKYGQYFSQYDIRDFAVLSPKNKQTSGELLIGVNDQLVSKKVSLNSIEYSTSYSETTDYIAWMKSMIRKGYAVTVSLIYDISLQCSISPCFSCFMSGMCVYEQLSVLWKHRFYGWRLGV